MGESMSKRLKLQLGGEAEMEERAFANPYADYQPPAAEGAPRDKAAPGDEPLPFGTDGKVRRRGWSWGRGATARVSSLPAGPRAAAPCCIILLPVEAPHGDTAGRAHGQGANTISPRLTRSLEIRGRVAS